MRRRAVAVWGTVFGALVLAGLAAALVWNEARKEVVFLCGNFTAGVTSDNVERQLATGHFLRYRREPAPMGSRIVVDSAYTLGAHRCTIELDMDGVVRRAGVE